MLILWGLTCTTQDVRGGLPAPCHLIVNFLCTGYRSSFSPFDRWKKEAQPRVVGQPAGRAGVWRKWSDFHTQRALVFGPTHFYPIFWSRANRGRVKVLGFPMLFRANKLSRAPAIVTSFTTTSIKSIHLVQLQTVKMKVLLCRNWRHL